MSGEANVCGKFGVLSLICSGTIANGGQEWEEEDVQLAAKAERGFVTQSLLWLEGLSTRERNPTRGGLWLSFFREFREFRKLPTHLVVALVGGVPQGRRRRLLLVRHHPQQLLNLEAEDTLQ